MYGVYWFPVTPVGLMACIGQMTMGDMINFNRAVLVYSYVAIKNYMRLGNL